MRARAVSPGLGTAAGIPCEDLHAHGSSQPCAICSRTSRSFFARPSARRTSAVWAEAGRRPSCRCHGGCPSAAQWAVVATPSTPNAEPRMDAHQNARTTPLGRLLMVARLGTGWSVTEVAAAMGVTARTVRKGHDRCAAAGEPGLPDRDPAAATGRGAFIGITAAGRRSRPLRARARRALPPAARPAARRSRARSCP